MTVRYWKILAFSWLSLIVPTAGCDGTPTFAVDAGSRQDTGAPPQDGFVNADGGGSVFASLSISGCLELTVSESHYTCQGEVPLALSFSTLAPPTATSFLWDFGDGSPTTTEPTTDHTYSASGLYTVELAVGGPFGTIFPPQVVQIDASPASLGAYCEANDQCVNGNCLCSGDDAHTCPAVLRGTCTATCPWCPGGSRCADLTVDATDPVDPWRHETCLATCETTADCNRSGFECRELPIDEPLTGRLWMMTCFPQVLGDVGAGCHDADDHPDPSRCLSGRCAALGRYGMCTDGCAQTPCPSYAVCASFSGGPHAGEALCVTRCDSDHPCDQDPQLACEQEAADGELGFVVLASGEPAAQTYCAPRRCVTLSDCPTGTCDLLAGGFCR